MDNERPETRARSKSTEGVPCKVYWNSDLVKENTVITEKNFWAVLRIHQRISKVTALNRGSFSLVDGEPISHVAIVLLPEVRGIVAKK